MGLKKYAACVLAVLVIISAVPVFAAGDDKAALSASKSGSLSAKKYSKAEICEMLDKNRIHYSYADLYEKTPSYRTPYKAGTVKQVYLQAAADRLNVLRNLAGLSSVRLDAEYSENAQYGSVILAAINNLTHYPYRPVNMSKRFYDRALNATSHSNIYYSSYRANLINSVDAFMDDSDIENIDVLGHRRWQLNPVMGKVGFGQTDNYIDEWVVDKSGNDSDYNYISWPPSGNFPASAVSFKGYTAWSISLNPDRYGVPDVSSIKVNLTRKSDGRVWKFSDKTLYPVTNSLYYNINLDNYAIPNCIIFRPGEIYSYDGKYNVEVTGLRNKSGNFESLNYEVEFFDPEKYPFEDVRASDYFFKPVVWALETKVASGVSNTRFEPETACSRAQAVQLIWGAAGRPDPTEEMKFTDVPSSAYYANAVAWALSSGVSEGTSEMRFSPEKTCTRGQIITMLWRAKGSPASSAQTHVFKDVKAGDYYRDAVAWAIGEGVTSGTAASTFSPDEACSRAQITTFLYRAFN